MELSYIQKRFSKIYIFVNILWWMGIIGFICWCLSNIFIYVLASSPEMFQKLLDPSGDQKALIQEMYFTPGDIVSNVRPAFLSVYFIVMIIYLYYLRRVIFFIKKGEIFIDSNARDIKKAFWVYIGFYLFVIIGSPIFTMVMLQMNPSLDPRLVAFPAPTSVLFLWLLYEIFKVSFYYKKENDTLKEEASLTI